MSFTTLIRRVNKTLNRMCKSLLLFYTLLQLK